MIPARWVVTALGAGVLAIGAMFGVHYLKEQGRNELRPKVAELESQLAAEKAARKRSEAAANSYWAELGTLARRPVPAAPVRLRVSPEMSTSFTPADRSTRTTATAGSDDKPPGSHFEEGPDIGPDLYGLAYDCDAEIAKLRALQGWINDVR